MVPIFLGGELVYQVPDLQASRSYCQRQVDSLWDEVKRFENPHNYYVDLSQKLWDIKQNLLNSHDMLLTFFEKKLAKKLSAKLRFASAPLSRFCGSDVFRRSHFLAWPIPPGGAGISFTKEGTYHVLSHCLY